MFKIIEVPEPHPEFARTLTELDARFYALCDAQEIVPPIGRGGLPPQVRAHEREAA